MKKIAFTLLLLVASFSAYAQPTCPSGQQNQLSKWKFIFSQCMEDSLFINYATKSQVAYVDAGGVLTTISLAQLLDSLNVPGPDGNQWNIQVYDSGEFGSSVNFNFNTDQGVFYVTDFNGDTMFSVNTQTREIRASASTYEVMASTAFGIASGGPIEIMADDNVTVHGDSVRLSGTVLIPNLPDSSVLFTGPGGLVSTDSSSFFYSPTSHQVFVQSGPAKSLVSPTFSSGFKASGSSGATSIFHTAASGAASSTAAAYTMYFLRSRGTLAAPSQVLANNYIGRIRYAGWGDTSGSITGGSLNVVVQSMGALDLSGNNPFEYRIERSDAGNATVPFKIDTADRSTFFEAAITQTPKDPAPDTILTNGTNGQVMGLAFGQGVYKPGDSATANIDAITLDSAMYTRIGNMVTVTGRATIDATATGTVTFYMTIPVASNMATPFVAGVNSSLTNAAGTIIFGTTQRVLFRYVAASASAQVETYTFTYRIN